MGEQHSVGHMLGHVLYQSAGGVRLRRPRTPVGENACRRRNFTPGSQDVLYDALRYSFGCSTVVAKYQSDFASARASGRDALCHRCRSTCSRSSGRHNFASFFVSHLLYFISVSPSRIGMVAAKKGRH